MADVLLNLAC